MKTSRTEHRNRPGRRRRRQVIAAAIGLTPVLALLAPSVDPGAADIAAAQSPVADPTGLGDPFFSYQRPEEYGVASSQVDVAVRDGSTIRCQLYRPAGDDGTPAAGRFPGIVYEYTAYADNAELFGEQAGWFVKRGYDALVCQARGSGESPGVTDPFSPQEQRDNYDVIEWFADQPHSTGDIGQMGVSYGGHSSLLVAVNQPPSLRAVIPVNALSDWYENTIYRGGIYSERIKSWQASTAPQTLQTYAEHPLHDEFWEGRSVASRWEKLTIPVLEMNGWSDRYRDGMVENYTARPENVWLVSGPWQHGNQESQYAGVGLGGYLAWWDHWLRGDADAPLPAAKVTSYETPGPGAGIGWHQFSQWPPANSCARATYLTTDKGLATRPGQRGTVRFAVNTGPRANTADEQVVFRGPRLEQDMVLAGDIEARIRARFSAADGNLAVVVYDEAADGSGTRVTEGWLKASHRNGHHRLVPTRPGQWVNLDLDVWPLHYRFEQGHRLRIVVSSSDFPEISADAPAGRVDLSVGAGRSRISLPVLDGCRPQRAER